MAVQVLLGWFTNRSLHKKAIKVAVGDLAYEGWGLVKEKKKRQEGQNKKGPVDLEEEDEEGTRMITVR